MGLQNPQPKKSNCWFSRVIERNGPDYMETRLTGYEVNQNAERIINDLINGKVDFSLYGKYVLMPVVFNTLLAYCRSKVASTSAELYCLKYTMWNIEKGEIVIGNTSSIPTGTMIDPSIVEPPLQYDAAKLNNGIPTITRDLQISIATEIKDTEIAYKKYSVMIDVLNYAQSTNNVYALSWAREMLQTYIWSNNKYNY